jgi:hypothetical protein
MAFEVISGERRWHEAKHPLYKFMCDDYHPDIEVFSSVSGMWAKPRRPFGEFSDRVDIFDELGIPLI